MSEPHSSDHYSETNPTPNQLPPNLRFVVLHHKTTVSMQRPTHWDLMLERQSTKGAVLDASGSRDVKSLATWALASEPTPSEKAQRGTKVDCEQLPPHRRHYLDYEGPVPGDRGSVTRWDSGTVKWLHDSSDLVRVELNGEKLRGTFELRRTMDGWQFSYSTS